MNQVGPLSGEVAAESVEFSPDVTATTQAFTTFLEADPNGSLEFSGGGFAERLVVNWTRAHATGVGPSRQDPNGSLYTHAPRIERGEREHRNVTWDLVFRSEKSNLLVSSPACNLDLLEARLRLEPSRTQEWTAGAPSNVTLPNGSDPFAVPVSIAGAGLLGDRFSTLKIGDGSILAYVWGGVLAVDGTTYRSGTWSENATTTPGVPTTVKRDEYTQLLRLTFENATLTGSVTSGKTRWHAEAANTNGRGSIQFAAADSYLESDAYVYSMQSRSFTIHGDVSAQWSHHDEDQLLVGHLDSTEATVDYPPTSAKPIEARSQPEVFLPTKARDGGSQLPWLMVAVLAAAAAVAAFLFWRSRMSRDPLDMAEMRLRARQSRRARWWARRALRRSPDDVDAAFVYGASFLQQGQHEKAVRLLGPLLDQLGPTSRPILAFLIGLALARLNRAEESRSYIALAASDPVLRERMQTEDVLRPILAHPSVVTKTGHELAGPYA